MRQPFPRLAVGVGLAWWCACTPGEQPPPPADELPPARQFQLPAGASAIDSTAYDVDADGEPETVALYAQVERDAQGRLLWEDAHRWVLVVRDGPDAYALVDELVPFGSMRFAVVAREDGPASIVAERHDRNGFTVETFTWDGGRAFTRQTLDIPGDTIFRSREVR